MRKQDFEEVVRKAVEAIPDEFLAIMQNVDIQVRRQPTKRQLKNVARGETLLGQYEGVPLTERHDYNMALPDVITIFQAPIEALCTTEQELVAEVRDTIVHEVAHYFGITDVELEAWGVA